MKEQRRGFIKKALGTGAAIAVASGVGAVASEKPKASGNGVVKGKSPKKEILYKKTANWEIYYNAAV